MNYTQLSRAIYEQNRRVGWWDNPDRCLFECLQLVSTEVAEATEGERKNLMDDHLPHRRMGEVKLADALIRVLDLGGRMGWEYAHSVTGVVLPIDIPLGWSAGRKHLQINVQVCRLAELLSRPHVARMAYMTLIDTIAAVADSFGYDLEGAVYDRVGGDPMPLGEARAGANGKKF